MAKEARKYKDGRRRPSNRRLRELVLHIASRCEDDSTFGATKLNKILFFADFTAYLRLGKSITGHPYQALKQGPAPKRLLPLLTNMRNQDEVATKRVADQGFEQRRTVALREADLSLFTPAEVAIVDEVIQNLRGLSATEVSARSHRFIGWEVAREGEMIPYGTALIIPRDPNKAEIRRGKELDRALAHGRTA